MPIDNKRIAVPDNSLPYNLFVKSNNFKDRCNELLNSSNLRRDNRKVDEHRKIFLQTDVVSQAKGSAYIEIGKTKVIVSVYDPREIPNKGDYQSIGELYCEFKYTPFSCIKRRQHQKDAEEKQKSLVMRRSLEAAVCRHEFPNSQVDIYAVVLEDDGSALSAAITAAGTALAHAGVPMFDVISSVEIGIQSNYRLLDPTIEEKRICRVAVKEDGGSNKSYKAQGTIVFSVLSTLQQVSGFHLTGNLGIKDVQESMELAMKANIDIATLVKKCLVKHVIKSIKERDIESYIN